MNIVSKLLVALSSAAIALAAVVVFRAQSINTVANRADKAERRVIELEQMLQARKQVDSAKTEIKGEEASAPPRPLPDKEQYNVVKTRALASMRSGDLDAAVRDLVWCSEHAGNATERGIPIQILASLAKRNASAFAAVQRFRDEEMARVQAGGIDMKSAQEISMYNMMLGDAGRNVELFDSLPRDSAVRKAIGPRVFDSLVAAGRYEDALEAKSAKSIFLDFDRIIGDINRPINSSVHDEALLRAGNYVETLAAVGRVDDAQAYIEVLLTASDTPEMRNAITRAIEKAKRPDLKLQSAKR